MTLSGKKLFPWLGVLLTGLLIALSFPPFELAELAWIALAPLLISVRTCSSSQAWWRGLVAGLISWVLSIYWVGYVTIAGMLILCAYCSVYTGLFAVGASYWFRRFGGASWLSNLGAVVFLACLWTALEFGRCHLFTGFPWNPLGVSQFEMLALIQVARWGGVYAVSFILALFSAGVATTLLRYREARARPGRTPHPELILAFLAVGVALSMGLKLLRPDGMVRTPVSIGLVQPNIPQPDKWSPATVDLIYQRLRDLTTRLHEEERTDLIVWPETALPDEVRRNQECHDLVKELVAGTVPLLVGTMDTVVSNEGEARYLNSSFLFQTNGALDEVYDKQHLVMFGEYIPLERYLPFLNALTPGQVSFSAGRTGTVFRLERPAVAFSSLICFEDALPGLSRQAVKNGARFLVNQTNDAWFEQSGASRQHMAHCVFRCVENRVPAVRSANTGVSCAIDHRGAVAGEDLLTDESGSTFVMGTLAPWVLVPPDDMPLTVYTECGDLFTLACTVVAFLTLALLVGGQWLQGRKPAD